MTGDRQAMRTDEPAPAGPRVPAAVWCSVAAVALAGWGLTAPNYAPAYLLELGWTTVPRPGFAATMSLWTMFGTVAALALTGLLARGSRSPWGERMSREWRELSDRRWLAWATVLAGLGALVVRLSLLRGTAIADDETAYRYAAGLLASGRLSTPSESMRLFFDHPFFVNDGRFYPMYFLGWPALLAPFLRLGVPGLANVALFAATIPALFTAVRERWSAELARIATLVWITSPFLLVLAGTGLSHTSCLFALTWALRSYVATRRENAASAWHACFAAFLVIAFWIRPMSAIGVGAPLGVLWLRDRLRDRGARIRPVAAFALPAIVGAALFLTVNAELTGSPWTSGYERARDYQIENDFRFSPLTPSYYTEHVTLDLSRPLWAAGVTAAGLYRLGFDLSGWPIGLLALLGAIGARRSGLAWGLWFGSLGAVIFLRDAGIDTFGPVHYAEMSLAWVLLVSLALLRLSSAAGSMVPAVDRPGPRSWGLGVSALIALTVVSWLGWVPLRWRSLGRVVENVSRPERVVAAADLGPAVVFAPFPWIHPRCQSDPASHFRLLRPVSGPGLAHEETVWVNHVDLERDRELMRRFEGRRGLALRWSAGCVPVLIPLESATEAILPPARQKRWW